MANNKRIKGITIELEGDTTGLDKALKDVNKESNDLSKELRDVQKLLKFNPGNAELVAQKQELLAKQIENTTSRLNMLREAESQVDEQFRRGNIDETQYRNFRREVADTEGALGNLQDQLQSLQQEQANADKSMNRLDRLFQATGQSVDDFADTLGHRLTRAIHEGTASSAQLDDALQRIGREALGARADLNRMTRTLDSVDDGHSIANVRRELDQLSREADNADESFKGLDLDLESMVGAAVAGGGITEAISSALDLSKLKTQIDVTFKVPEASKKSVLDAVRTVNAYGVDAEEALSGIRKQWALNADVSDKTNSKIVQQAGYIASAYSDIDFGELIQESNEFAAGIGTSQQNAIGLIDTLLKAGFPPDQIDIMSEYGTQLHRAGFNAAEIQNIFAAGVDTKTWNIDNLLDGLKEGRVRLAAFGQGIDKTTAGLLKGTGISQKQLQMWGQEVAQRRKIGSKSYG